MSITSLRALRYFALLAEDLNFRRAADRLHIAQPALSRQIKHLEEDLGVTLFDRTRRSIRLTAAGEVLLMHSKQILLDVDKAINETKLASAGLAGSLSLAFIPSSSYVLLPEILKGFRAEVPDVHVEMYDMVTSKQLEALSLGRIDIGIMRAWAASEAIEYRPILSEPFVVAVPEGHPLAGVRKVNLKDFGGDQFLIHARESPSAVFGMYDLTLEFFRMADFRPRFARESPPQLHALLGMVKAGFGIAVVPRSMMHLPIEGVRYATLRSSPLRSEIGIGWRKDSQDPILQHLARAAAAVGREFERLVD